MKKTTIGADEYEQTIIYKQQQEQLRQNSHVKRVSEKAITYTDSFKQLFIHENEQGKLPSQIFEEAGFDAEVLGTTRIWKASSRWRAVYKDNGVAGLEDTRKYSSGRPLERELSTEEKYARLEAKMKLVQTENELLKKLNQLER